MVGYLEGIGSERGIAWRCADSFSLREFLGYGLAENPPEHSTLSKTRKRLSVEAHAAVFGFVLERLQVSGLLRGKTLGVDATTLEANAALRTIVRRADGTEYEEWLAQLARASGIETPTREDLAKLDRKRPNKGSNKDWVHPHDPEARITKMKDGRTHLAHKLEHAVDMETGAIVGLTVQTMDGGDTASLPVTLDEAERQLEEAGVEAKEVVADKGYHSNATMTGVKERKLRAYVSEPNRGRRKWKGKRDAQKATYANRRRIRGNRGKRRLRGRGEKVERPFAHLLETGGMRRLHVRSQKNIRKRMLVHAAAFNLDVLVGIDEFQKYRSDCLGYPNLRQRIVRIRRARGARKRFTEVELCTWPSRDAARPCRYDLRTGSDQRRPETRVRRVRRSDAVPCVSRELGLPRRLQSRPRRRTSCPW